ncbi:hypothetical protein PNH38_00305 [Anoxybacillus rupiensis]|uniref:Uncharacterized protein n=1 Tax=Anoxybacteroides rupiense TaxID=311460 RepID=A0ABT5W236_9BACL|nr:hypothetical protein [Anoxybacillus rupiensis]
MSIRFMCGFISRNAALIPALLAFFIIHFHHKGSILKTNEISLKKWGVTFLAKREYI